MAVTRIRYKGTSNIGVFILATEKYALVPPDAPDKVLNVLKETLEVEVVKASIGESSIVGVLAAGNSEGVVVPYYTLDEEIERLRKTLQLSLIHI